MSLSRGQIQGFLLGQIAAGKTPSDAKIAFRQWLGEQNESVATTDEKTAILDDIDSYSI